MPRASTKPKEEPSPSDADQTGTTRRKRKDERCHGEFFFATVKAIGTPIQHAVIESLKEALDRVDYTLTEIRLSERLREVGLVQPLLNRPGRDPLTKYDHLMDAGDELRITIERGGALAVEAVRYLNATARTIAKAATTETYPKPDSRVRQFRGVGYVFRSLMHRDEARRLRTLYGQRLFIIAAYYPMDERADELGLRLANGDGQRAQRLADDVARLIRRDAGHLSLKESQDRKLVANRKLILNVSDTFPTADLFVDARDAAEASKQVRRLVELIFAQPFHTPTVHEVAMAAAYTAAEQSANLARRVGAAIVSAEGDLIATGSNDVPKAGGGVYRANDVPDYRDHQPPWQHDPSDLIRRGIVRNFLEALLADPSAWMPLLDTADVSDPPRKLASALAAMLEARLPGREYDRAYELVDSEKLVEECIRSVLIWSSEIFDVIEYARGLHAEMDAITTAARRGLSLQGATMYCTTLPCHECARLIIGSGISTVYFIEPYEKSRVAELYKTEIHFGAHTRQCSNEEHVHFLPYVGISPARFDELFSWVERKVDDVTHSSKRKLDGKIVDWNAESHTGKVRSTIITNDALYSQARLDDLIEHEGTIIDDYLYEYQERTRAKDEPMSTGHHSP